jgi:RNA methyltransferase, TrmH family
MRSTTAAGSTSIFRRELPVITSASNPRLKLVRRLLESRRQREKEGLFVCEGEDLVAAADAAGVEPVDRLRAGEDVDPELLARITTMAHPPRVLGVYSRDALPHGLDGHVGLALWHVADPGNVGTLLRAADAFGAFVALSAGCADVTNPRALRASSGAVFRVPTGRFDDAPRPWVALVAHGGRPLPELEVGDRATFVVGSERLGIPDDVVSLCDEAATIPLAGDAESLNVAMAGTVALYEVTRSV